jgi:ABC-2 type transport system permease protein
MNIFNKGLLKLVLLPSGFYRSMGVDIMQLRTILEVKLTMDDRRVNAMAQARRKKKAKPVKMATLGTMLISGLMGIFFLFSFSIGRNIETQLTFYYSMMFFMLAMTLIADFTSVLIDVRDNLIILPKPVNDRTFVVARLLHIFIHICKIVIPMSLAGIVYMISNYGAGGGILFFFIVILVTAFTIFFINGVYILILKITSPKRFQAIISYFQIVFAIAVYGSYQVLPRLVNRMDIQQLDLSTKKWVLIYPVYWLSCSWKLLFSFHAPSQQIVSGVLGLLLPVVSILIVLKYLAPAFNNKLALIGTSGGTQHNTIVKKRKKSFGLAGKISRLVTSGSAEKVGFDFVWRMTSRSRDFKLKVYPAMGYMAVYVVVMFLNSKNLSLEQIHADPTKGKVIIISAIYLTSLLLVTAINQIMYSEKYKASWIYYTTPLQWPGHVIAGGTKAAIIKFYFPLVMVITIAGLFLLGPAVLPNIVLGLFNEVLIATLVVYMGNKQLPFSTHQSNASRGGNIYKSFVVVAISGVIGVGHFFLYSILPAIIICIFLSGVASWLMMDSIKRIGWEKIISRYSGD